MQASDIIYTALFVNDEESLLNMFPPKHPHVFAHHSTICFRPTDISDLEDGKQSKMKVTGRVSDEKGDALIVENPKSKNIHPHITLFCADNVKPTYSNEMIERAYADNTVELFAEPVFIEVTEGYVEKGF